MMDGEKQFGGIGVFCQKRLRCIQLDMGCKKHVWVHFKWQGQDFAVAVIYMTVEGTVWTWNESIIQCLLSDLKHLQSKNWITVLLGNFIGHLQELDDADNVYGSQLCYLHSRIA